MALVNQLILEEAFQKLDKLALKSCRLVCKSWSRVARPILLNKSYLQVPNNRRDNRGEHAVSESLAVYQDMDFPLKKIFVVMFKGVDIAEILDTIKGTVRSLRMAAFNDEDNLQTTNAQLPYLTSLGCYADILRTRNQEYNGRLLIDLIRRSPNLRELTLSFYFLSLTFFTELEGNDRIKQTLTSLRIQDSVFEPGSIQILRNMNLKLARLGIHDIHCIEPDCHDAVNSSVFSLWINDLSHTLESLILWKGFRFGGQDPDGYKCEFLTEMTKLKRLEIHYAPMFIRNGIIPVLDKLPNLEVFILKDLLSTCLTERNHSEISNKGLSYPKVTEFTSLMGYGRTVFDEAHVFKTIPLIFPNLKKLTVDIYSKKAFFDCTHELKGMGIEEVRLEIKRIEGPWNKDDETYPSFSSWKEIKRLTLVQSCSRYFHDQTEPTFSMTHLYGISIQNFLSKSLTYLSFTRLQVKPEPTSLIKLLHGLPQLMTLEFSDCRVDPSKPLMQRSAFMEQIGKDPLINPYLCITFPWNLD